MDQLKKFFPMSFKFTKDGGSLALGIILHFAISIAIGIVVGILAVILAFIPIIGWLLDIVLTIASGLVGLYLTAGIVILIVAFCLEHQNTTAAPKVEEATEEKTEE